MFFSSCERDQVQHPYKTSARIMVLFILIFKFLEKRWEAKDSELIGNEPSPKLICLNFFTYTMLVSYYCFKILELCAFSKNLSAISKQ